ncbi:MAG: hypothetical protein O3A00_24350 [Planctomycetota bacterium]|nr:hypothetical protein [Planctomycetota bacterium]
MDVDTPAADGQIKRATFAEPLVGVGNLIESNAATGPYTGTFTGTVVSSDDPNLAALADNGGPTRTFALNAGSPAIDAGNAAASSLVTDQRGTGFGRVTNSIVDIGAFEFGSMPRSRSTATLVAIRST